MNLVNMNLYCCYAKGRWFDSLFGSGRRSIVSATLKTRSDEADVAVVSRNSRAAVFR